LAIAQITEDLRQLLAHVLAESSQQVYSRAWVLYRQFASLYNIPFHGVTSLPIHQNHVAAFISYMRLRGLAPTSIISYISALGYVHRLAGKPDPTRHNLVQKLISAATKINPISDPRLPITIIILHRLVQAVQVTISIPYHRHLIQSMFITAFFGLMRIGELTIGKVKVISLKVNQVQFSNNQVILTIKHFKHNKAGRPVQIVLSPQQQVQICPVAALTTYLQDRGSSPGPLFCFPDGNPISRNFFTSRLSNALKFVGMDVTLYKSHSFRIGGSSYYASLGFSDSQIRVMGRWNSNAFIRYIRCQRIQNSLK
jgi:hypothetical protein